MRRLWLGVVLLVALLALGLWVAQFMDAMHQPMAELLNEAAEAAMEKDWREAERLSQKAKSSWDSNWTKTASVADHSPMDEIDGLFAQLPAFIEGREEVHFAATCAQLAQLLQAMGDAHSLDWWSLL